MTWLLVAIGGALGSVARYGVTHAAGLWLPTSFPFGTFLVNAIGCAAFGLIAGAGERSGVLTPALRAFCLAGVLGGFTTYSAFALETTLLGFSPAGMWYVLLTVVGCIGGAWLGKLIGAMLLAQG